MIGDSDFAIISIKKNYLLSKSISGTILVYKYALKKNVIILEV